MLEYALRLVLEEALELASCKTLAEIGQGLRPLVLSTVTIYAEASQSIPHPSTSPQIRNSLVYAAEPTHYFRAYR